MSAERQFDFEAYYRRLAREEAKALDEKLLDELQVSQPDQSPSERLVNARHAAEHLSISERQLRQLASERAVPFHRIGTSLRFKLSELERHTRVDERRLKPA